MDLSWIPLSQKVEVNFKWWYRMGHVTNSWSWIDFEALIRARLENEEGTEAWIKGMEGNEDEEINSWISPN